VGVTPVKVTVTPAPIALMCDRMFVRAARETYRVGAVRLAGVPGDTRAQVQSMPLS
jgi:hypothetical protein